MMTIIRQTLLILTLLLVWASVSQAETARLIVRGSPDNRRVALTFDDGPSPYTRAILPLLHRHHARATFFVLGSHAAQYPGIIRALVREGHEVENHSFSHIRFPQADRSTWRQELERTEAELALLGVPDHDLIRPPYSDYNRDFLNYLGRLHERLVLWSVDSRDWSGIGDVDIAANVLKEVHNGAIVIFHDGDEHGRADRSNTVAALKIILPVLKARGSDMVTVSELLASPEP